MVLEIGSSRYSPSILCFSIPVKQESQIKKRRKSTFGMGQFCIMKTNLYQLQQIIQNLNIKRGQGALVPPAEEFITAETHIGL